MSKLVSTRDPGRNSVSFIEALLQGLAPDGGLYVPAQYPKIDKAVLHDLASKPYIELFTAIKGLFVGSDIDPAIQADLAQNAYAAEKFPDAKNGNLVPVTEVESGFFIQNLSLGPTAAFKDMALQPLGQDMNYVLGQQDNHLTLLGATSGDTGSSAEAALKGLDGVSLFMLSPETGMSTFQKAQMGMLSGGNIYNLSIRGRFDDCQDLVKRIKRDPEFAGLGAVNSINWGRIASQVPYYVSGYLQVAGKDIGSPVDFAVPTGNFGNILAGYIARQMGVPIRRLIVATNENDVIHRLIQTGEYTATPAQITSSPSMDISKASNYERLVYELLDRDPKRVLDYMQRFETKGSVTFKEVGIPPDSLKRLGIDSGRSTHQDRIKTIKWVYETSGQIIDPHTADAVHIARQKHEPDVPIVSLATALPVKFEPTIKEALGFVPERSERFRGLEQKTPGSFTVLDNDPEALKAFIREHQQIAD